MVGVVLKAFVLCSLVMGPFVMPVWVVLWASICRVIYTGFLKRKERLYERYVLGIHRLQGSGLYQGFVVWIVESWIEHGFGTVQNRNPV